MKANRINCAAIGITTLVALSGLSLSGCSLLGAIKVNGKPIGGATSAAPSSQATNRGPGTPSKAGKNQGKGKMVEASGQYGAYPEIFVEEGLAGPEHCFVDAVKEGTAPLEDQIRSIGCASLVFVCTVYSEKKYCKKPDYRDGHRPWFNAHHAHVEMSDRGDALTMGLMIAAYARDKDYYFQTALKKPRWDTTHRAKGTNPHIVTGQLLDYVPRLKPDAFRSELAKTNLPASVKSAVAQLIPKGIAMLQEDAKRIPAGLQAIAIEVPKQIRSERAAHYRGFRKDFREAATLVATLDAAVKSAKPDRKLFDRASNLRNAYLEKCRKKMSLEQCIAGPLTQRLTQSMIRLARAAGNDNLAYAENFLIFRARPEITLADAISAEQERQVGKLMERYNSTAERQARKAGGGSFKETPQYAYWRIRRFRYDSGFGLDRQARWNGWTARVKSIRKRGDKATISFYPDDAETIVAYNCSKKNKFVGFDSNGGAIYDKVCNHRRKGIKVPVKPVTIDASETKTMRKGEYADFVRTENGSTHFVYARNDNGENARITALRGLRLKKGDLPNFWERH